MIGASQYSSTGGWKARLMGVIGQRWKTMRMITGSRSIAPIAHARGQSMEIQMPFASSGFLRRTRTLRVDIAFFYLESNCMECLLKKAVKSAKIYQQGNLLGVA